MATIIKAATMEWPPGVRTEADVRSWFRRQALRAHPDTGGSCVEFQRLVKQRDAMLAHIAYRRAVVSPSSPAGRNFDRYA